MADEWTRAMRGGDYVRAWALSAADLAGRDPATRDDPALAYHLRWVWAVSYTHLTLPTKA